MEWQKEKRKKRGVGKRGEQASCIGGAVTCSLYKAKKKPKKRRSKTGGEKRNTLAERDIALQSEK